MTKTLFPPSLNAARQRLLTLLRELAYERREVVLSSGLRSNFYIDCKQVSLGAEGQFLIGQLFHAAAQRLAPSALAVGGLTLGADPLATATSVMSYLGGTPLDAFIVRKEPKGHGTGAWIEGADRLAPGASVIVLEDVVTTGASTLKAIDRVEGAGFRVAQVIALVDRQEGGREAIEARAPMFALYERAEFEA